jgi:putative hydrolase of the HAD superfamily
MREIFDTGDRRHVFDQILAESGCEQPGQLVPEMVACYRSHRPRLDLFTDADERLTAWRGSFRLGLISDGPQAMQQRKVDALGLTGRLDAIILTDQWGRAYWKPHPRAFREMEEYFGSKGRQCVYLADNPGKDFVAPRSLGWRTVRVLRPGGVYADVKPPKGGEPEFTLAGLQELDLII